MWIRLIIKFATVLALAILIIAGWLYMEFRTFVQTPLNVEPDGMRYTVDSGTSVRSIADELEAEGIVDHAVLLRALVQSRGDGTRIQAGEYHIEPGTTPDEFLDKLIRGDVVQYSLTVVEGWTFQRLIQAIRGHDALEHTLELYEPDVILEILDLDAEHPEGWFLPDTYRFPRGMTDVAFLTRAYRAMDAHLATEWEQRQQDLVLDNPYEALVLASIVEKEARVAAERPKIAGVFLRRLELGMRLQADATVIYAAGDEYDGRIRYRDLRRDNPYNTYTQSGLPPTPIAMPSKDSIRATLNPEPGDALYFVARGDGTHHFSATLEEHNRAVDKYIRGKDVELDGDPDN